MRPMHPQCRGVIVPRQMQAGAVTLRTLALRIAPNQSVICQLYTSMQHPSTDSAFRAMPPGRCTQGNALRVMPSGRCAQRRYLRRCTRGGMPAGMVRESCAGSRRAVRLPAGQPVAGGGSRRCRKRRALWVPRSMQTASPPPPPGLRPAGPVQHTPCTLLRCIAILPRCSHAFRRGRMISTAAIRAVMHAPARMNRHFCRFVSDPSDHLEAKGRFLEANLPNCIGSRLKHAWHACFATGAVEHRAGKQSQRAVAGPWGQAEVLVCARGGGGLLRERMALASQLWAAGLKAEFLPQASDVMSCMSRLPLHHSQQLQDMKILAIL